MESKVLIDINVLGDSSVKMVLNKSDDLRDKVVEMFMDDIYTSFGFAEVEVYEEQGKRTCRIVPIRPPQLNQHLQSMQDLIGQYPQSKESEQTIHSKK